MFDRIRDFADKDYGCGASDSEIAAAEQSLGVLLPDSYRSYLRLIGWARFSHCELYGLGLDTPPHLGLVNNTVVERNSMEPALPLTLVPLMNDGAGNHYCLDTSATVAGECPVVFWDHEAGTSQCPELMAQSFPNWLVKLLDSLT